MIEPGTLIIGVSEEGVLHQFQLCRGQRHRVVVGTLVDSELPQHPTLSSKYRLFSGSLYTGLAQQLHISFLFSPLDICAPFCHGLNLMYLQSQAWNSCSINPSPGSGIGLSYNGSAAEASPSTPKPAYL